MLIRRHADTLSFVRSLELHHSINWHAAVLLVAASLSGLLVSWLLLQFGLERPWLRFPVAVLAAYGLFLLYVNWWLAYIGIKRLQDSPHDVGDPVPDFGSDGGAAECATPAVQGGGGSFDGGGASASFEATAAKAEGGARVGSIATRTAADPNVLAVGADDVVGAAAGAAEFFPVALLAVAVVAMVGAIGWSVMLTPVVLVETAVEVAIASGLIRSAARWQRRDWLESLFERTVGKAVALVAAAVVLGAVVRWIHPEADTLGQAIARLAAP